MKLIAAFPLFLLAALNLSDSNTNAFTVISSSSPKRTTTSTSHGFITKANSNTNTNTMLHSAAPSDVEASSDSDEEEPKEEEPPIVDSMIPNTPTLSARNELLKVATSLTDKSPTGIFLTIPSQMSDFNRAVARLEAIAPSTNDESEALSLGDWTLVATSRRAKFPSTVTAATSTSSKDESSEDTDTTPAFLKSLPKPPTFTKSKFTKDLQSSITVTQRIRSMTEAAQSTSTIDRIDHVIAFDNNLDDNAEEPKTLLPPILNPLKINQSKFTLVHNAKVESFVPFVTNLNLSSIIVNVAGEEGSALKLDPKGADVLGINIPQLSGFMNGGTFETTYVDGNVRVSRGTISLLEETRVFVKAGFDLDGILSEGSTEEEVEEPEVEDDEEDEKPKPEPTQLKKVAAAVGSVVDALDKTSKDVQSTIKTDLESSTKNVQKVLEEDFKEVESAVNSVKSAVIANDKLETAVDGVVGAVNDLGKDVKTVVDGAVDDLKTKVEDDGKKIQSAVEDVRSVVSGKDKEEEKEEDESESEEAEIEVEAETETEEEESEDEIKAEKTKPEEKSDDK